MPFTVSITESTDDPHNSVQKFQQTVDNLDLMKVIQAVNTPPHAAPKVVVRKRRKDSGKSRSDTAHNRIVEYDGRRFTLANLAREFGVPYHRLKDRLNSGWSVEDALNIPVSRSDKGITRGPKTTPSVTV